MFKFSSLMFAVSAVVSLTYGMPIMASVALLAAGANLFADRCEAACRDE